MLLLTGEVTGDWPLTADSSIGPLQNMKGTLTLLHSKQPKIYTLLHSEWPKLKSFGHSECKRFKDMTDTSGSTIKL